MRGMPGIIASWKVAKHSRCAETKTNSHWSQGGTGKKKYLGSIFSFEPQEGTGDLPRNQAHVHIVIHVTSQFSDSPHSSTILRHKQLRSKTQMVHELDIKHNRAQATI